jgi:hypothetical protein
MHHARKPRRQLIASKAITQRQRDVDGRSAAWMPYRQAGSQFQCRQRGGMTANPWLFSLALNVENAPTK